MAATGSGGVCVIFDLDGTLTKPRQVDLIPKCAVLILLIVRPSSLSLLLLWLRAFSVGVNPYPVSTGLVPCSSR